MVELKVRTIMSEQKKDTSPLVKPTRHKQTVRIQEVNKKEHSLFPFIRTTEDGSIRMRVERVEE